MKNSKKSSYESKVSLMIIAFTLIVFIMSCSKSSNDVPNTNFAGTYTGKLVSGFYNEADTVTIPASNSSAIVMNTKTGSGSIYTINGTVSGSALSIPSQSVFISKLGATYNVTGNGTLSNSTLVINYVFATSSDVTTNLTFTGTRN